MPDVPIVAVAVLLLLHVPPPVLLVSVVVVPTHRLTAPDGVMAAGVLLTVTMAVARHPPGNM